MVKGRTEDITKMLPVDAWLRRLVLLLVHQPVDPVYLMDRQGHVLREWAYVPSLGAVDDACKEIIEETV